MDTAAWYRWFADHEAAGSSPSYERLAHAVADSDELIAWLDELPAAKRQPNLLFASVRFLGGDVGSVDAFSSFLRSEADRVASTMNTRSTQTNEVARCGAFVPILADLDGDISLIEVGASAGLCLFPDRLTYRYDGRPVGDGRSDLEIAVDTGGTLSPPVHLPSIRWRAGLDLNPLDVTDADDLAWLRACVWPEHHERRRRLELAAAIVADHPPRIERGDLLDATLSLVDDAPSDTTKAVFHSAVLAYVDDTGRREFADSMRRLVAERDDVVWISNEHPTVVGATKPADVPSDAPTGNAFHLVVDGADTVAVTDPHGSWLRWSNRSARRVHDTPEE